MIVSTRALGLGRLGEDGAYPDPSMVGYPGYVDLSNTPNYLVDPIQGEIVSTGEIPTFSTTVTETLPSPTSPTSVGQNEPIPWGDELSSFMDNLLGGGYTVPITVPAGGGGSKGQVILPKATVAQQPKTTKSMPKVSPIKPPKVGDKPNVGAYEQLLRNNLVAFLASGRTAQDQQLGENYFLQEWNLFSNEMGQAGSWGTQGLRDRNRGGQYDWWHAYYDPITQSQTIPGELGVGELLSQGGVLIVLAMVGVGAVIWATN